MYWTLFEQQTTLEIKYKTKYMAAPGFPSIGSQYHHNGCWWLVAYLAPWHGIGNFRDEVGWSALCLNILTDVDIDKFELSSYTHALLPSQIARFMGPTWGPPAWALSAPDGPHVGPMNLAIRDSWCYFTKFLQIIFRFKRLLCSVKPLI